MCNAASVPWPAWCRAAAWRAGSSGSSLISLPARTVRAGMRPGGAFTASPLTRRGKGASSFMAAPLKRDRAFEVESRLAGEDDTVTAHLAGERAATRRELACDDRRFAEPAAPIRHDRAMRRSRHCILIDTERRREIA